MAIDRTTIEIEFRPDAIYLTQYTIKAGLPPPPPPEERPRDLNLPRQMYIPYAFNRKMHRIKVTYKRKTKFEFKVKELYPNQPDPLDREWRFYSPGFELKETSTAYDNRFTNRTISQNRRKMTVDFDPKGDEGRKYDYNLWLEAPCVHNGVDMGHMIIIVDPIIISDEL
jgi:hypothetical protein